MVQNQLRTADLTTQLGQFLSSGQLVQLQSFLSPRLVALPVLKIKIEKDSLKEKDLVVFLCVYLIRFSNQPNKSSIEIIYVFTQSLRANRMWHKVNF